jgi:AhpD family alkylhydroperoxidase
MSRLVLSSGTKQEDPDMTPRINLRGENFALMQTLIDYATRVAGMGLEKSLVHLVEIRASQINGCAVCLHMHVQEALKAGESPMRLHMVGAWRESSLFSERERAALGWTEALTRLAETRAPDEDYAPVAAQFSDKEQIMLSLMIGAINSFNKLNVGFRVPATLVGERKAA